MIVPTDQLYRDQVALIYQNPQQFSPRILIALALIESGETQGLQVLKRCLEVSFQAGYPTMSLWILSLCKKYAPLASYQDWYTKLSEQYSNTLNTPKSSSLSYADLLEQQNEEMDDLEKKCRTSYFKCSTWT